SPSSYEVYFSSDLNLVAGEDASALIGTVTEPTIETPMLSTDTVYYWSVKQDDASGVIWSFETNKTYPIIISQPQNAMVFAGEEAVFEVVTTSNTEQSYQWFNTDGEIPGAQSASLVFPSAQIADQSYYYCEISNNAGTVTSANARLLIKREVGHWSFNMTGNDPNTAWVDYSGSANDLQPAGSPPADPSFETGVDGGADGALVFDGNYYLVTKKEDGTMNDIPIGDEAYTVSFWINSEHGDCGLIGWGNYGYLYEVTAINLNFDAYNGWLRTYWWAGDLHVNAGYSVVDNAWHQITATYDGDIRRIYVDGLEKGFDDPVPHAVPDSSNFAIGVTNLNDPKFNGKMDEVVIYNYALDALDIALDYADMMDTDVCVYPPVNDLDNDCKVTISDFSLIAVEWLDCGLVPACQ
ncbi:MAG: LamG-like jellyroll fold domain-containing protein, partial [Phycisphaerae bacterium]